MKIEIDNFIGVFPNALSKQFCESTISFYEQTAELGKVYGRKSTDNVSKTKKDTTQLFLESYRENIISFRDSDVISKDFIFSAWNCYELYADKYGILSDLDKHQFYRDIKIQKTNPTEGYHMWHCEHGKRNNGSRLLLVIGYLNDVSEGGETEFLYQSKRVPAKEGTILICPSGFTHTHRGNPPLNGAKYIINGWIEFV